MVDAVSTVVVVVVVNVVVVVVVAETQDAAEVTALSPICGMFVEIEVGTEFTEGKSDDAANILCVVVLLNLSIDSTMRINSCNFETLGSDVAWSKSL